VRIEKLKAEHHVRVKWVHFPLHPDTPAEGRSLDDLFAGRQVDRKAMHAQMKARMDAEGLPYGERTMTYNSRLAQELGKWAGRLQQAVSPVQHENPTGMKFAGGRRPLAHRLDLRGGEVT
jgi:predicted DsbA family dithiol-disulfide isomerase